VVFSLSQFQFLPDLMRCTADDETLYSRAIFACGTPLNIFCLIIKTSLGESFAHPFPLPRDEVP